MDTYLVGDIGTIIDLEGDKSWINSYLEELMKTEGKFIHPQVILNKVMPKDFSSRSLHPYSDIHFIEELGMRFRLFYYASFPLSLTSRVLVGTNLLGEFNNYFAPDTINSYKPWNVREVMLRTRSNPGNTWVVTGIPLEVKLFKERGIKVVYVDRGMQYPSELPRPDLSVSGFIQLSTITGKHYITEESGKRGSCQPKPVREDAEKGA